MDFVGDSLAGGRTFRTLTVVDDFSREAPAIVVDQSCLNEHWFTSSWSIKNENRFLPEPDLKS